MRIPACLMDGGEMGAVMRAHDWEATPFGDPASWPQALTTLVGVMLGSNQPVFILWGPARRLLYNDAYARLLGAAHPAALGHDYLEVWPELRFRLEPDVAAARAGRPVHRAEPGHALRRRGGTEAAGFSQSYVPIRDADGRVAGLYGTCAEIAGPGPVERPRETDLAQRENEERQSLPYPFAAVRTEPLSHTNR